MRLTRVLNPAYLWQRRHRIPRRVAEMPLQFFRRLGCPVTRSDREIVRLKRAHAGRRAFIIGNGPSLSVQDLDRLHNQITFASNKIYLAFSDTSWRPTYYFVTDLLVAQHNASVIGRLPLKKFMVEDVRPAFKYDDSIIWLHDLKRNEVIADRSTGETIGIRSHFSNDILIGVDPGWSVIYTQLQVAFYMGVSEVVLIGVDFSFSVPQRRVQTNAFGYEVVIESEGERNHFHPDYRKPGELWSLPQLECQKWSFEAARNHYESCGRRILNASRRTALDVFERADFDRLLEIEAGGLPSVCS
jgi:6-hydroxymethylpterin diphosphokinase MptE-like protein